MKSFCLKNEDYLKIIKLEKATAANNDLATLKRSQSVDPDNLSVEEAFRRQSSKLTLSELEREIANLKTILGTVLLPNLGKVDPEDVSYILALLSRSKLIID